MASATQRISLQLPYAAQSFLAFLFGHRNRRGPRFALLVGCPRHHPCGHAGLVDRLSFRLVLTLYFENMDEISAVELHVRLLAEGRTA